MNSCSDIKTIFRFKEFEMSNSLSAMKVSTDSVLLGSWVDVSGANDAIDVGSGTGLLSLMLAQRGVKHIIGAEISEDAYVESVQNARLSPWPDRFEFLNADVTTLKLPASDLVISNPPYFELASSAIISPSQSRRLARHETELSYAWLLNNARNLLRAPGGRIAFISPTEREPDIEFMASVASLGIARKCLVSTTPRRQPSRILWELRLSSCPTLDEHLFIHDSSGGYSPEYIQLTRDFYVKF